jgi:phosphoglucosamine mutase
LDDIAEAEIERRVFELLPPGAEENVDTVPPGLVTAANSTPWPGRYVDLLLSHFPSGRWLDGFRIVLDCANGAMSEVAPTALKRLGAEVLLFNAAPTGININANCGAVHLDALMSAMAGANANFGVAFDGDGDRSLFASGGGRRLDGDAVLLMMARRLKREGRLNPSVVVGTLMTNFALEKLLETEGIALRRVAVGDRYIFEEMQKNGGVLGGEPSGHIIFSDFRLSGDGLLTTLKVAEDLVQQRKSFDDLTRDWVEAPQLLKGVRVSKRIPLETLPAVQEKLAEVESALKGRGRLVVRYSGTEPLLRVMIESDDAARNARLMEELLETIRKHLIA